MNYTIKKVSEMTGLSIPTIRYYDKEGLLPDLQRKESGYRVFSDRDLEAIDLIKEKEQAEAKKHIKKFEAEPELEIMNGRYGPYIAYKGNNYKIPKDIVPEDLSLESCLELVKLQSDKETTKPKKGRYAKKK